MARQNINIGTTANDGTGTTLRAGGEMINDNFIELYGLKFGKYNYNHSGTTQSISASTWTHVINDGGGANTILTCVYPDVDIYNTTTSLFSMADLELCSDVELRFDANITTTTATQAVRARVVLAYGVLDIPLTFISEQYITSGTYPLFGSIRVDNLTVLTKDNPFRVEIWSDAACTLDLNGWNLKVNKIKMG